MNWWHTIELPNGEVTNGRVDYRGQKGDRFLLPKELTGKSVLDFGTWDGFWSIEARRRGAAEVVATDRWVPPLETAQKALNSCDIPYVWSGDMDFPLSTCDEPKLREWLDHFDVVLFYGILYHQKNPYQGLRNAFHCCKPGGMVIVESAVSQGKLSWLPDKVPLLWVIDDVHHDDPSNYFMPNINGVLQLCRLAGLEPTDDRAFDESGLRFTVVCRKP